MIGVSLVVNNALRMVERMHWDLMRSDAGKYPLVLVAVDNGSTDYTGDWLRSAGWTVLRLPVNQGIVAARNLSFWRLVAEPVSFVLEVHADMRFPASWFDLVVQEMADPKVWIASPRVVTHLEVPIDIAEATSEEVERLCLAKRHGLIADTRYGMALNHPCLHRMEPFRERGFYDDRYEWQDFEDLDLYYEWVHVHRRRAAIAAESVVYHYLGAQRLQAAPVSAVAENERRFREKWGLEGDYRHLLWPELENRP